MGLNYKQWTKIIINNHRCRVWLPRSDGCKTQPFNIDLGLWRVYIWSLYLAEVYICENFCYRILVEIEFSNSWNIYLIEFYLK